MGLAKLSKTTTLLEYAPGSESVDGRPLFIAGVPEAGEVLRATYVRLDRDVWDDMDQPTKLTVTIEPGENLNNGSDRP